MVSLKTFAAAAAFSVMACAGMANAASVTLDSVSGSWVDIQGGKKVKGAGTSEIRWGTPVGGSKSGYDFDAVGGLPGQSLFADKEFALGTFTHHNQVIEQGGSITGATLKLSIGLNINGEKHSILTSFDFSHWETPNESSVCGNGGKNGGGVNRNGCADEVTALTNFGQSETFVVDGQEYAFTISGFDGLTSFWTTEKMANSAMLTGFFTQVGSNEPSPVPLPAAAWLLGAGVAGLGLMARRRRS